MARTSRAVGTVYSSVHGCTAQLLDERPGQGKFRNAGTSPSAEGVTSRSLARA
eukprot:CAMPEP_0171198074 /NCGR_PEP_ID=MMETSP0790-20130122/22738_1 /TAXON_ID=2925 /ORGANISM="Alexandrium catenella, Strain OF101" /LENGTH=52 /DNA_ID=CAMNT_0011663333 /DNA_START=90 /DNA_END=245 /DNA_ORIENTATION=+